MAGKARLWERRLMAVGLLVLALLVLGSGYRMLRRGFGRLCDDFLYPYLRLARIGSSQLSDRSLLAYSRSELAEKLEELQRRNRDLALQAAAAGKLLEENAKLRKTAHFSPPPEWSALTAEVIMRDPMMWRDRFTVDRGSKHGVVPGAAVIDIGADGRPLFIGVIEHVGRHSSSVQTLHNGELRIAAQLGSSQTVGFVNAGGAPSAKAEREKRSDGMCPIGYLPRDVRYLPGEAVVTTGFERGIPAGLVIGELVSVENMATRFSGRLYLSGWLRPAAEFDGVRFVVIAVPKAGKAAP